MQHPPKLNSTMRRISPEEPDGYRFELIALFAGSPDPYTGVLYHVPVAPSKKIIEKMRAGTGKKITMTHVINKLLAHSIAENPVLNQVLLGGKLYEKEAIHIANAFLLPGPERALAYVVTENAHKKSLPGLHDEMNARMTHIIEQHKRKSSFSKWLFRMYFRLQLYRLLPQKKSFTVALEKGLCANIVLSNHVYKGPTRFVFMKPATAPVEVAVRIHTSAPLLQPYLQDDTVLHREVMPLTLISDHRMVHGIHGFEFGQSLEKIWSNPDEYLQTEQLR